MKFYFILQLPNMHWPKNLINQSYIRLMPQNSLVWFSCTWWLHVVFDLFTQLCHGFSTDMHHTFSIKARLRRRKYSCNIILQDSKHTYLSWTINDIWARVENVKRVQQVLSPVTFSYLCPKILNISYLKTVSI